MFYSSSFKNYLPHICMFRGLCGFGVDCPTGSWGGDRARLLLCPSDPASMWRRYSCGVADGDTVDLSLLLCESAFKLCQSPLNLPPVSPCSVVSAAWDLGLSHFRPAIATESCGEWSSRLFARTRLGVGVCLGNCRAPWFPSKNQIISRNCRPEGTNTSKMSISEIVSLV